MIAFAALLLAQSADVDSYPDAAHRADQARTAELNRRAADQVGRRLSGNGKADADYQSARHRYEKAMAEWRQRVAACEAGYYQACR